jgi:hypothetical protein
LGALAHAYFYHDKDQENILLPENILKPCSQICERIGRQHLGRNNFDTFLVVPQTSE